MLHFKMAGGRVPLGDREVVAVGPGSPIPLRAGSIQVEAREFRPVYLFANRCECTTGDRYKHGQPRNQNTDGGP